MKLSVLLTTTGRPTLLRTLLSLKDQAWLPGDELAVVSDDNHGDVAKMITLAALPVSKVAVNQIAMLNGPYGDWGHTPRNKTMRKMAGDYIAHFDDDDVAMPHMIRDMNAVLAREKGVHMFRMLDYKTSRLVWTHPPMLQRKRISTQNIVHPNEPSKFGVWEPYYGGDAAFIIGTAKNYPGHVFWHDVITCVYNPPHHLSFEDVISYVTYGRNLDPAKPGSGN